MKELKGKKVGTALGIAVICLFSTIYLAIIYYTINSELQKYGDNYYKFYVNK